MLQDEFGRPMTPTHAAKGAKRYRYYVSTGDAGPAVAEQWPVRIPAGEIEKLVTRGLGEFFKTESRIAALAAQAGGDTLGGALCHPMMAGAAEFWLVRRGFYFTKSGAELPVVWLALLCLQMVLGDGAFALMKSTPFPSSTRRVQSGSIGQA
jgi:hypothetical protein